MDKILYINPVIETIILVTTFVLFLLYSYKSFPKTSKTEENTTENGGKKKDYTFIVDTVLLILSTIVLIGIIWTKKAGLIGRIISAILLIKPISSVFADAIIGVGVVHKEIGESDSKNLSLSGKAMLLSICLAIGYFLCLCPKYFNSFYAEGKLLLDDREGLIIIIVVVWYYLLTFHLACLVGIIIESIFSITIKLPKLNYKNTDFVKDIPAKLLISTCKKIKGVGNLLIRIIMYAILVPIVFIICLMLRIFVFLVQTIEMIIKSLLRVINCLINFFSIISKKIRELGDKCYVWFCFRVSIIIAVVITVSIFIRQGILKETTLNIFVFIAETLVIPLIINELMRAKDIFGRTPERKEKMK